MLDDLRKRIREVDGKIAALVAERLQLAGAIGEEKEKLGLPVRDFATEKRVHDSMAAHASEYGIDPDILAGVTRHLIRGAVKHQAERRKPLAATGEKSAAIIGGAGHMGRWFGGYLSTRGYGIRTIEAGESLKSAVEADLVVVCVPLDVMRDVLESLIAQGPRGTVIEIASLKSSFTELVPGWIEKGVRFASTHPMFGADADMLSGQNMIICEAGCPEAEEEAAALFNESAVNLVRLPLEEHDRMMTWVLNLPHLMNLLMADLLTSTSLPYSQLQEIGGTTFNRQNSVTREVVRENPGLYYNIQRINRHRDELYSAARAGLERVIYDVQNPDPANFVNRMEGWRSWFGENER